MIKSIHNPTIKDINRLKKSRERKKQNLALVEGYKEIIMSIEGGAQISKLFYCPDYARHLPGADTIMSRETIQVINTVFDKIAYRENPDGFLAVIEPPRILLSRVTLNKHPLIVVLEKLEKPGNLGAILRTADSVGVDVVIVTEMQTDIYNPNVIRASLGAVFTNQLVSVDNEGALGWLKENNIKIISTSPSSKKSLYDSNLKEGVAIVIGTEHEGLSDYWLNNSNENVLIPMKGKIDSLNASVSAAVILYETYRQRNMANIS